MGKSETFETDTQKENNQSNNTDLIDAITLNLIQIKALTLILTDEDLLETQTHGTLISLAYLAYTLTEDTEKAIGVLLEEIKKVQS